MEAKLRAAFEAWQKGADLRKMNSYRPPSPVTIWYRKKM